MQLRHYILSRINALEFYKNILSLDMIPKGNVPCPIHEDKNPSMSIREDGSAHCYGCKKTWKNIIQFYMDYRKVSTTRAIYVLYNQFIEPLVSRKVYMAMFYNLKQDSKPYRWLMKRGIGRRTIQRFLMGHDEYNNKISLPIFNEWGYCVNIRLFRYKGDGNAKVISFKKNMGKPRLFPLASLYHKDIYIFEGEMDTLLAIHNGLNAVTVTAGAMSWRREFTSLFQDKIVYICLDNDSAGQQGAKIIAKELTGIADRLYNIILPKKFGKDFTDFIENQPLEAFLDLVSRTRQVSSTSLKDIRRLKDIQTYAQEETMIVPLKPEKNTIHLIVKVVPED